jgi:hypothetical protein
MSVIFPTEPAQVNIHLLPKKVDMVSYEVSDTLRFSAWMPDEFETIKQSSIMSCDRFYDNNCRGCQRNTAEFYDDYRNEFGDIDWEHEDLQDHCSVYDEGYTGQYCPEGYHRPLIDMEFSISNMVFEIYLNHIGTPPRFTVIRDSAYLQKFRLDGDSETSKNFLASPIFMASNVFGTEDDPEGVCWGYNPKPNNLREMVSFYFSTPFNNDLTSIGAFERNCASIRAETFFSQGYLSSTEKYFCRNADAIMLLDAEHNIQAFYTMLMAGFKPLPEAMHVIAIPLKESEFERGGKLYRGFTTVEDAVGKNWFVSPTSDSSGLLVGQL